jgi:hypothetical protein
LKQEYFEKPPFQTCRLKILGFRPLPTLAHETPDPTQVKAIIDHNKSVICEASQDLNMAVKRASHVFLIGVGEGSMVAAMLLRGDFEQYIDCSKVSGILFFISNSPVPAVYAEGTSLSAWYKQRALVYIHGSHSFWSEKSRIRRYKRYGKCLKHEGSSSLPDMFQERHKEMVHWIMQRLGLTLIPSFVSLAMYLLASCGRLLAAPQN